jgi:hypothetical protein
LEQLSCEVGGYIIFINFTQFSGLVSAAGAFSTRILKMKKRQLWFLGPYGDIGLVP